MTVSHTYYTQKPIPGRTAQLNVIDRMIKLLECNSEESIILTLDKQKNFLELKNFQHKRNRVVELIYIKIKDFCLSKDSIKKVKRQATEQKNKFLNFIITHGFVSRLHK